MYRFFFSYSSETWKASNGHLERFYDALCKRVAQKTGERINEVGYRDESRLSIAAIWSHDLVTALQSSRVLVSIISPHYLKSEACGREVQLFIDRFNLLNGQSQNQPFHRIVPIFWVDQTDCSKHMNPDVESFFHGLQIREDGLINTYPSTGLERHYIVGEEQSYNNFAYIAGAAVARLSELEELPKCPDAINFEKLPFFFPKAKSNGSPRIGDGPNSASVIYAVATSQEAAANRFSNAQNYADERANWRPFVDAPGATIEMATQEALNRTGELTDKNYQNLGLPEGLGEKLKQAKINNSPILIVLDQASLLVPSIESPLSVYDELDYRNVGLVSAGGPESNESGLMQILPTKYGEKRPNHTWTALSERARYVQEVCKVVGGLRKTLQQTGVPTLPSSSAQLPGL